MIIMYWVYQVRESAVVSRWVCVHILYGTRQGDANSGWSGPLRASNGFDCAARVALGALSTWYETSFYFLKAMAI